MDGERYRNDPRRRHRVLPRGTSARPTRAAPTPTSADRVLSLPQAAELRAPRAALARRRPASATGPRISDEELLLRLTMPAEQVDAMVQTSRRERPAPPRPGRDPRSSACSTRSPRRPAISYLRPRAGRRPRRVPPRAGGGRPLRLDDVARLRLRRRRHARAAASPDGVHPAARRGRGPRGDPRVGPAAGDLHETGSHMPPVQFARELRADGPAGGRRGSS